MTLPQAFDLALQRHHAGRLAEAEALYRQILAAQPNHADALHLLGVIAHQTGRHDLAAEWIRQAILLDPNNPSAHSNLAEACRVTGRFDEAIAACRRALELRPGYPEAHINLGSALRDVGLLDEAIAAYRRALALKPDSPETHNNLGNALKDRGQLDEASAAYRRALALRPDWPEIHNNLGNALKDRGQLDEAIAAHRSALQLRPDSAAAYNNLGNALKDQGELDGALAAYRRAIEIKPDHAGAHGNLVYALLFHPGATGRTIAEAHQVWNRQFGDPLQQSVRPHGNDRNPERRLRIGYVSPDFRDHVVGRNLLPLWERHDPRSFEILCYSGVVRPDKLTDEFRRHSRLWRGTVGVGDEALAGMIREDGVDILVDLTQHMAGNRLPMFARQPAPIQVSFAGYPGSTGLEAIEYRISDRCLEAGSADKEIGRKEQIHLIDSFWCYDPRGDEVEVHGLPALESGRISFGCLNNFCKVNERVLALWARVLGRVKGSRLVMRSPGGSHRQRTLEALEREGIDARRVEFVPSRPQREYLEQYHQLDIVLDTAPYNGHTTSLDALWMGVPVVSLAGETPVSRGGLSQLTNLGLPDLVTHSESEFVTIAESLANDLPRLARLRSTLRHRMENSVLMDAPRFARNIEAAYRAMWQHWCAQNKG